MRVFLGRNMKQETDQGSPENVSCNQCGREIVKNIFGYLEDHLSVTKTWGYGTSADGETHSFDLCLDCYSNLKEKFVIPPQVLSSIQEFEVTSG